MKPAGLTARVTSCAGPKKLKATATARGHGVSPRSLIFGLGDETQS
jgi:hypothetical protein